MNLKNINTKELGKRLILIGSGVAVGATLLVCGKVNKEQNNEENEVIVTNLVDSEDELNDSKTMYLNVNLNVRSNYFIGGNKITELSKGTKVLVNTEVDTYNDGEYDWVYISYVDEATDTLRSGWVVAVDYTELEPINYLISEEVVEEKENERYVSVPLNVRTTHAISHNKITGLVFGTKVYINKEVEPYNDGKYEWVYINYIDEETNEEKSGWVVSADYTTNPTFNNLISYQEYKNELIDKIGENINSRASIVYDATNGDVLYEKNGYELFEPASITKVITAYIVSKYGNLDDNMTYSDNAINVDGKRQYDYGTPGDSPVQSVVRSGNTIKVKDALYISILLSDNATTVALQEYIESITGRNFEDIMNEEIKNMGCEKSNFTNSFGFEDPKHVVSPYEMAKIVSYINRNNKEVMDIMGTISYKFNYNGKEISFRHQSSIINPNGRYYNENAIGCKTGFTDTAGQTMVTVFKKDGKEYVIVTMKGKGASSKFADTTLLYNNIDNFLALTEEPTTIEQTSEIPETSINKSIEDEIGRKAPNKLNILEEKKYIMKPNVLKFDINYTSFSGDTLRVVDTDHYYKGIDVSSHQGSINWEEVSETIDFAIIRVGKTAYRTNEYGENVFNTVMVDESFEYNISECNRLGIPVGVYYYSLAETESENLQEIKCILEYIENYDITLPVYRDIEAASLRDLESGEAGRINQNNLTKQFCDIIRTSGYDTGVYINKEKRSLLTLDEGCSTWLCGGYYYGTKSDDGMSYETMPYIYESDGIIYQESEDVDILQVSEYGNANEVGIYSTTYVDYNYADKEFINEMISKKDKTGKVKVYR